MTTTAARCILIRYCGYYYDVETKLYYLINRYYDPEVGRFISPDHIGYMLEQMEQLNGCNLYAYCLNNPVMGTDPEGTFIGFLLLSMAIGAGISALLSGVKSYSEGNRGLALIGDVVAGALVGAASGAAMALGAASGLASIVGTVSGFSLSFGAAIGISVGATAIAEMGSYTIKTLTKGDDWDIGSFIGAGFRGAAKGGATFYTGYFGERNGLYNRLGHFTSRDQFYLIKHGTGKMSGIESMYYAATLLVGERGARFIFMSSFATFLRKIIDSLFG